MSDWLKTIKINNFKLYQSLNQGEGINLAIPNGTVGSGLTILIGENNSGKSTVVSALSKLKENSKIHEIEKYNLDKPTEIAFIDSSGSQTVLKTVGDGSSIGIEGSYSYRHVEVVKETRVWTSDIQSPHMDHYSYLSNYDTNREVVDSHLASRLANLQALNDETYVRFNEAFMRIIPELKNWTITSHSPRSGDHISYRVNNRNLEIDTSLGSGMLNLFRIVLAIVSDNKLVAIDEPEVFLHPKAQINLCNEILESSKEKQIIYTTHSPYMFSSALSKQVKIYSFKGGSVEDISANIQSNLISWNYLSWEVFGVRSNELHIEIFEKYMHQLGAHTISNFNDQIDANTSEKKVNRCSDQSQLSYGNNHTTLETLPVWVRNYMHHPEYNQGGSRAAALGYYRTAPTDDDIDRSINFMINEMQ